MEQGQSEKLASIFESFPEVKLVYFFGSKANADTGAGIYARRYPRNISGRRAGNICGISDCPLARIFLV